MTAYFDRMFRWTLRDTMDANGITRYALQKETGLAMNTVRAMYEGTPTRIDFPIIEKIIVGLAKITGKKMSPDDVFTWEPQ